MNIWESSESLFGWDEVVPAVTGSKECIIRDGILAEPAAQTPEPRCKAAGYLPLEWLSHWKKAVGIILNIPAEEYRTEWMRLIRKHMRESA